MLVHGKQFGSCLPPYVLSEGNSSWAWGQQCSWVVFVLDHHLLHDAQVWSSHSQLRKGWMKRMARVRCPSCPSWVEVGCCHRGLGDHVQDFLWLGVNLLKGREMFSWWRSCLQPRIILTSKSPASAVSFFFAAIVLHGVGYSSWMGWVQVWMAISGACLAWVWLFVLDKLMDMPIKLSIYISCVPHLSTSTSTISSLLGAKGVSSGRKVGGGKRPWSGV